VSKWKPISEAPRDGSYILAVNMNGEKPSNVFMVRSMPEIDNQPLASGAGWRQPYAEWPSYPTHWMPLPKPPEDTL